MELFYQGILGLDEDTSQSLFVQGVEVSDDRKTAYNFRDETEFLEVGRREVLKHVVLVDGLVASVAVADDVGAFARCNDAVDAIKGTSCDEKDVFSVDGNHLLLGVFAPPLGRHVDD